MSYFSDASLVLVPSAQKSGKVYSIKPTDGTGDLTFTRTGDTASRIAPNGLLEKVRTNNLLNSVWAGVGANVAPTSYGVTNFAAGTFDAGTFANSIKFVAATSADRVMLTQAPAVTGLLTISVYVHEVNGTIQVADVIGRSSGSSSVLYYYEDGQTIAGTTNVTAGKTYALALSVSAAVTWRIGIGTSGPVAGDITLSSPQVEFGDIATDYIATTTAAVSVGPVANVPRLDYSGGSSCPRLLLEPQRTNLNTFSDGFTNGWTASGGTITATANYGISPDGYQNSTRLQFSAANLILRKAIIGLTGNVGTWSLYIKGTAGETLQITYGGVDLLITLGTGWNRYSVTGTGAINEVFLNTFAGSTARDIEVYGGQAELGSYPSSYVNTLGAAVTRGADAASKTGISSLIGQTEGTLYAEVNRLSLADGFYIAIAQVTGANSYRNSIYLFQIPNGNFICDGFVSNVLQFGFTKVGGLSVGTHKIAIAYKANDFALYIDGVQIGTDNSGSVPTTSIFGYSLDGGSSNVLTSQAILFPTRLQNSDLAALTA